MAERGITVRALIEQLIDQARADTSSTGPLAMAIRKRGLDHSDTDAAEEQPAAGLEPKTGQADIGRPNPGWGSGQSTPLGSPCAEIAQLMSLTGRWVVGVVRLTASCARLAGTATAAPFRVVREHGERM